MAKPNPLEMRDVIVLENPFFKVYFPSMLRARLFEIPLKKKIFFEPKNHFFL